MDLEAILSKTGQKLSEKEAEAFKKISVKERIGFWQVIATATTKAEQVEKINIFKTKLIEKNENLKKQKKVEVRGSALNAHLPPPTEDSDLPPPADDSDLPPPAEDSDFPPPAGEDSLAPPVDEPELPVTPSDDDNFLPPPDADEEEFRRKAEESMEILKQEETKQQEEELRKQAEAEEEQRKQKEAEEEESKRKEAEAELAKQVEEEERRQQEAKDEERRQQEAKEEEQRKQQEAEEAEQRKQQEMEEEQRKLKEMEEEQRKLKEMEEEEDRKQKEAEVEFARQAEEERKQKEIEEEEERKQKESEEEFARQAEEAEQGKKEAEEEEKKMQEEGAAKQEDPKSSENAEEDNTSSNSEADDKEDGENSKQQELIEEEKKLLAEEAEDLKKLEQEEQEAEQKLEAAHDEKKPHGKETHSSAAVSSSAGSSSSGHDSHKDQEMDEADKKKIEEDLRQKMIKFQSGESNKKIPFRVVKVSELEDQTNLRKSFIVTKINPKKFHKKKRRALVVDLYSRQIMNMKSDGKKIQKVFKPEELLTNEKDPNDPTVLYLKYLGKSTKYKIICDSGEERNKLYQCVASSRPKMFLWCPNLCLPNEGKTCAKIEGSMSHKEGSKTVEVNGSCMLNVSAKPFETIQLHSFTWNMSKTVPPRVHDSKETLENMKKAFGVPEQHDIYVIATQETGFKNNNEFMAFVKLVYGEEYVPLSGLSFVDNDLAIMVKTKHYSKITNICGESKAGTFTNMPTGPNNKGAVAIGFTFNDTKILVLNFNLPAEDKAGKDVNDQRIKNIQEIFESLKFQNKEMEISSQFHYIFALGTFNSKIEGLSKEEILQEIENNAPDKLLEKDQLLTTLAKSEVFDNFKEPKTLFMPTSKRIAGKSEYDSKIIPSYSDRILFKTFPGMSILPTKYEVVKSLPASEHYPVVSAFKFNTNRTYLSIFSKTEKRKVFNVDQISVCGNDKQMAHPLISFHSDAFGKVLQTKMIQKAINPVWTKESEKKPVVSLNPYPWNEEYLNYEHVTLTLKDGGAKKGTKDVIGACVVQFKELLKSQGSYEFALCRGTKKVGTVTLNMSISEI